MIGKEGITIEECHPEGKVKVSGELWKAKSVDGKSINVNTPIIVKDIIGLHLIVEQFNNV